MNTCIDARAARRKLGSRRARKLLRTARTKLSNHRAVAAVAARKAERKPKR